METINLSYSWQCEACAICRCPQSSRPSAVEVQNIACSEPPKAQSITRLLRSFLLLSEAAPVDESVSVNACACCGAD